MAGICDSHLTPVARSLRVNTRFNRTTTILPARSNGRAPSQTCRPGSEDEHLRGHPGRATARGLQATAGDRLRFPAG